MQAIDSSVAASDLGVPPAPPPHAARRFPWRGAVLAVVVGAMVAIMYSSHRSGHWWGDDWALYIRQAESLLDGDPGRVTDENRFTVDSSSGAPFSPPLYPWGFPMLLAPVVAIVGPDVDQLTIVPVLCSVVFACCWFALARPRLGTTPALVGVVAVTLTPLLLSWTELIQSEWPFLAITGVMLVALDRVAERDLYTNTAAALAPLVLLGIGAAAAFSVRREGLAMIAGIAAAQLAALVAHRRELREQADWTALGLRLLTPHLAALASVGLLQAILPSTLIPQYSGTGVGNVWKFRRHHVEHLAEVSGLKRQWEASPDVFGVEWLGWFVIGVYLAAALAGMVLAVTKFRARDVHLVAYALGAFVIGASFRGALNRYVATVAPILLLLGLVAVSTLVAWRGRSWMPPLATALLLAAIAAGNIANANVRVDRASEFADLGAVEWGPTHPEAQAMFGAVEQLTGPDEVVAAPKARAMTLETDRLSIQVDDYRPLPRDVPVALIVTEWGTDLNEELMAEPDRYRLVWENASFALFRPRAAT